MSDIDDEFDSGEFWKEMKRHRQEAGKNRREQADRDFPSASALASQHGLRLSRSGGGRTRYRLEKGKSWMKDLYPGNSRIYCPNPKRKGPFFCTLPREWSLLDVVKAAIEAESAQVAVPNPQKAKP